MVTPSGHLGLSDTSDQVRLSPEQALDALNDLRSNIIATQNAGWSNAIYPLVAILDAAGCELHDTTDEQKRDHLACYGGAGGYPSYLVGDTRTIREKQMDIPPSPLRGGQ